MKKRPFGMVIVGMIAGLVGVALCGVLFLLDPLSGSEILAARAGVVAVAALAFVAAEAILFVRPWFYRAAVALAVSWFVLVGCLLLGTDGLSGLLTGAAWLLAPSFVVIAPIIAYLGEKNQLMPRHPRAVLRVRRPGRTP